VEYSTYSDSNSRHQTPDHTPYFLAQIKTVSSRTHAGQSWGPKTNRRHTRAQPRRGLPRLPSFGRRTMGSSRAWHRAPRRPKPQACSTL